MGEIVIEQPEFAPYRYVSFKIYPFTFDQLSDYNFITKYCIDHLVNGSAAYNDYIKYDEFIGK
mgnify:CR=1 FL=1